MPRTKTYRFAARPKWIAGHILVVVTVIGFINLGFWQLQRHDERSGVNAIMTERMDGPAVALDDLVATFGEDPDELEFRRVRVSGTYLMDEEVLWQARTFKGRSGHDVLTPLAVDGRAVIVDRGWVSIDALGPPVVGAEPASVEAVVTGIVRIGGVRQGLGPVDAATGQLERISRVDIGRLQQQIEVDLYPFYILLESQSPGQGEGFPLPQEPPVPDAGPHLSYAFQWFAFAAIAAIGYPVLLVRTAGDEEEDAARKA